MDEGNQSQEDAGLEGLSGVTGLELAWAHGGEVEGRFQVRGLDARGAEQG